MGGEYYVDLGVAANALRQLTWALEIQRCELGEEDPLTLAVMHGLGVYYYKQAQIGEAREILGRTLELRRRVLGEEHQDTLVTMRFFAGTIGSEEGVRLLRHVLEVGTRRWGEKHREAASTMLRLSM